MAEMKKIKLDWNVYPAGADILLFDGAMHLCVIQGGSRQWSAEVRIEGAAGGGALFICDKVSSKMKAMLEAEAWVFKHAKELKATPRADAHTRVTKKPAKKVASKKTGRCSYCGRSLRLQKFGTLPIHDAEMLASRRSFMRNPEQDDYYETTRCPGSQSMPLKGKWAGKVGVVR